MNLKIVCFVITFILAFNLNVFAQDFKVVKGKVQNIEKNIIELKNRYYYPVDELLDASTLEIGQMIKILYNKEINGKLYYYNFCRPEENIVRKKQDKEYK